MFVIDAQKVRGLLFENGITVRELAHRAEISNPTAKKVTSGDCAISAKVVGKLAKFFGVAGLDLIVSTEGEKK